MTTQLIQGRNIMGLTPAVDPIQSDEVFVISGRNYVFDSKGPRSSFGNRHLTQAQILEPLGMMSIRVKLLSGDKCFYFTREAIYEWKEDARDFRIIYSFVQVVVDSAAWSHAYVNGVVYFNHPSVGILAYDVSLALCYPAAPFGKGVPTQVLYVTNHNSRLIAVTKESYNYSAQSNGLDFEPRLGFAGFQLTSDLVPGLPLGVVSHTYGTMTWTTGGLIRSEFRGDAAVYRHTAVETQYRPINSHCIARVKDDTVVILDERGLFQSKGGLVEPYAPMFNEFLIEYIRENRLGIGNYARLHWDEIRQLLFVSLSLNQYVSLYDVCFVYYPSLDKWGQFNEPHHSMIHVEIPSGEREGSYSGFIDRWGRARYFPETDTREPVPELDVEYDSYEFERATVQPATYYRHDEPETTTGAMSRLRVSPLIRPTGYYLPEGLAPQMGILQGLDASIKLGYYQIEVGSGDDDLTEITALAIFSKTPALDNMDRVPTLNDSEYMTEIIEAHTSLVPSIDVMQSRVGNVRLGSSWDGNGNFMYTLPVLVDKADSASYYVTASTGVWHSLELFANEPGESFRPVLIKLTAIYAGKIQ